MRREMSRKVEGRGKEGSDVGHDDGSGWAKSREGREDWADIYPLLPSTPDLSRRVPISHAPFSASSVPHPLSPPRVR